MSDIRNIKSECDTHDAYCAGFRGGVEAYAKDLATGKGVNTAKVEERVAQCLEGNERACGFAEGYTQAALENVRLRTMESGKK